MQCRRGKISQAALLQNREGMLVIFQGRVRVLCWLGERESAYYSPLSFFLKCRLTDFSFPALHLVVSRSPPKVEFFLSRLLLIPGQKYPGPKCHLISGHQIILDMNLPES